MPLSFKDQVAIVTGAGGGLGRSHALALASRGAKVVVNDFGGSVSGGGSSESAAERVVEEICNAGGQAISNAANVSDQDAVSDMVDTTIAKWGRVDILINNAGILRDKSFGKLPQSDWDAVLDVHLCGSFTCTRSVWNIMKAQEYGRIVLTSSASGLFGNFGQSNYATAKMALIGLMNVLHIEGENSNIRVNALAPAAATRMTEGLISPEDLKALTPESVTPALLALAHETAPARQIICAGGGSFSRVDILETDRIFLSPEENSDETAARAIGELLNRQPKRRISNVYEQTHEIINQSKV